MPADDTAPAGTADNLDTLGLQRYRDGDEAFFLGAAVDELRSFCGWHIAPMDTVTDQWVRCGQRGLIVLPTLHLVEVSKVQLGAMALTNDQYEMDPAGVVTLPSWAWDSPHAVISYTHGHPELPRNVQVIGYELVQRALDTVGGNTKDFGAGPYRMSLASLGVELTDSQRRRLTEGGYVLPGVR